MNKNGENDSSKNFDSEWLINSDILDVMSRVDVESRVDKIENKDLEKSIILNESYSFKNCGLTDLSNIKRM
jgi:hypothetical protein